MDFSDFLKLYDLTCFFNFDFWDRLSPMNKIYITSRAVYGWSCLVHGDLTDLPDLYIVHK